MRTAYRAGSLHYVTVEMVEDEVYIGACKLKESRVRERVKGWMSSNWLPVMVGLLVFVLGVTMGLILKS